MIKTEFELRSRAMLPCVATVALAVAVWLNGCTAKMTVEEASQVAVSMNRESYSPPPRSIDDITTILDQVPNDPETIRRLEEEAASDPPPEISPAGLMEFYYRRGIVAQQLALVEQSLSDFRKAMTFYGQSNADKNIKRRLFKDLAHAELLYANIRNCLKILDKFRNAFPKSPEADTQMASVYFLMGANRKAEEAKQRAFSRMNLNNKGKKIDDFFFGYLNALSLESKGKFAEAEGQLQAALSASRRAAKPGLETLALKALAENLTHQNRLQEAEVAARSMLRLTAKNPDNRAYRMMERSLVLDKILVAQNRFREAEKLMRVLMGVIEKNRISQSSLISCRVEKALGEILVSQGRWQEALLHLRQVKKQVELNSYLSPRRMSDNLSLALALLRTGQAQEALDHLSGVYQSKIQKMGDDHEATREIQALMAVAYLQLNQIPKSFEFFNRSVPFLLKCQTKNAQRMQLILEGYLELLDRSRGSEWVAAAQIDPIAESFRIAQASHLKSVQAAIAKSAARLAIKDSRLAEITRQEQDADIQIESLESMLVDHLSSPLSQQEPTIISDLSQKINTLRRARQVLRDKVEEQFPQYASILNPQPATVQQIQQQLHSQEAFISIYSGEDCSHVWAVPPIGPIGYARTDLTQKQIQQKVNHLRKALAPSPQVLGDIPPYDLKTAYELYAQILKPVEPSFENARHLLIDAPGPLGALPFSVLPTRANRLDNSSDFTFAGYRKVPWMIRRYSISRLPGANALISQRQLPRSDRQRRMFAGFGDPIFNPTQLNEKPADSKSEGAAVVARGGINVHVRGIRNTQSGNLDKAEIVSSRLDQLTRLPDTADEVMSIAKTLRADPQKDIFLGVEASESRIKTMDLSDRKVIVFASHALVPGDLDGLNQPALALSAPEVTGDQEDGMLTMEEIMRLKLNANWVVLSACNTGASDGAGAEAASGLGRAFLYAGSKSILVSMWPVETSSARKLTTSVFYYQQQDPNLSRSQALQRAMLNLIDHESFKDPASGRKIASYAHPLFWAPFIIVGEGAGKTD